VAGIEEGIRRTQAGAAQLAGPIAVASRLRQCVEGTTNALRIAIVEIR
jgi:hypothetical protein